VEKRSLSIAGHRTSISLEPEFWAALEVMAADANLSMASLIRSIDEARAIPNLSSAVRLAVLAWYQQRLEANTEAPA
jgi:predicted DNA-binding ribbon-helix-helix protein